MQKVAILLWLFYIDFRLPILYKLFVHRAEPRLWNVSVKTKSWTRNLKETGFGLRTLWVYHQKFDQSNTLIKKTKFIYLFVYFLDTRHIIHKLQWLQDYWNWRILRFCSQGRWIHCHFFPFSFSLSYLVCEEYIVTL